jgi:hypothetical protein
MRFSRRNARCRVTNRRTVTYNNSCTSAPYQEIPHDKVRKKSSYFLVKTRDDRRVMRLGRSILKRFTNIFPCLKNSFFKHNEITTRRLTMVSDGRLDSREAIRYATRSIQPMCRRRVIK